MEDARRKLRICLMIVVAAAVIVGMVYYFSDIKGSKDMTEGTLVRHSDHNYIVLETRGQGGNYGISK